jgi:hypothetical protein
MTFAVDGLLSKQNKKPLTYLLFLAHEQDVIATCNRVSKFHRHVCCFGVATRWPSTLIFFVIEPDCSYNVAGHTLCELNNTVCKHDGTYGNVCLRLQNKQ